MKIGILYICTGKYNQFFKEFYETMEKNFLPSHEKLYFVWSDNDNLTLGLNNVHFIHKECAGFPADSLFRYDIFLQAEGMMKQCDYLYYINANAIIVGEIGEEILPDNTGLLSAEWPIKSRLLKSPVFYHYERNKQSLAYIKPFDRPYKYYMGGLNGGTCEAYLKMIHKLADNIRKDYENGIIACSNDESHLNRYLHEHPNKCMPYGYAWPEEWVTELEPKIIYRSKTRLNGYFNKGRKSGLYGRICRMCYLSTRVLRWYLRI